MRCPVDQTVTIVVEYRQIELDYCVQCRGVWFDSGELELLLETLKRDKSKISYAAILNQRTAESSEAKRRCPICGRKMLKVWMVKEPEVLVDACPRGHGVWFDGGELNRIICQLWDKNSGEQAPADIIAFLEEALPVECHPEVDSPRPGK